MKLRGYIISVVLLFIDILFFAFGGVFIALAAIIYAFLGVGEYTARVKYKAITCDPSLGNKHVKLDNCYQRVREKISAKGHSLLKNIKVYLIPGDEMNAYCFGARSIGVTEGILNLDNKTVEAVIAHEIGHLTNGDSVLNMVLIANCIGIIVVLAFFHFALFAFVCIVIAICCMTGLFKFSFASYFITSKVLGVIRFLIEVAKTFVLHVSRLVISAIGRKSEFVADRFAADMGYAFYLRRFLERFASDADTLDQTFLSVLYNTHPSPALRIQQLNSIN